ncbi:anti-sigma factor RsiW [Granulicella aggregans]|uniref:Anti-sigma factor RsiW n=1 Tax=Granulicella aggregans TaxID=474949 RepID=A0A7W7ZBJ4_9BACT|nr:zf-HC2 domain-containing protein [Granulicella aggregans]MBB5056742.1 anti-sigma factor RsiW [Granulicella aggregans]
MMEHLSDSAMNGLADGELSPEKMAAATAHLASCSECTTDALARMMLKQTTAQAGRRYTLPDNLRARLGNTRDAQPAVGRGVWRQWAVAAALLVAFAGMGWWRLTPQKIEQGLATEITDQHVAAMAASAAPEVLSSDRHTVKPWFQGKIPFSFNVPEGLPEGTTLEGANLAYVGHRPAAQLIYSVGKHRASVFLMEKAGSEARDAAEVRASGFHIVDSHAAGLEIVAVSDVEMAKLRELVAAVDGVQR